MTMRGRRGTIALQDAAILRHTAYAADQYVLRLQAPKVATCARPGQFIHLQCTDEFMLRRPLSIMRTDAEGWIEVLYKPLGPGLAALTRAETGQSLSVLGPIGNGFDLSGPPQRVLALGGGVGIPPMIFAAQELRSLADTSLFVYVGSEIPFPFELADTALETPGTDAAGAATLMLLEQWGVPCVLTSRSGLAGSHDELVTAPAERTLAALTGRERAQTLLLACGPEPMLAAAARLAHMYGVPCQLALEEYMACGVGGCAGCTVEVHTPAGIQMQRVCVDGPVFEAAAIYPAA